MGAWSSEAKACSFQKNGEAKEEVEVVDNKVTSLCGAVNLLASIFGVDSERLNARYGLPTLAQPCLTCGKPTLKASGFCNRKCRSDYVWITVACDECGVLFKRRQGELAYGVGKRNYNHIYCSRKCFGKRLGRDYGFIAHPENTGRKIR